MLDLVLVGMVIVIITPIFTQVSRWWVFSEQTKKSLVVIVSYFLGRGSLTI